MTDRRVREIPDLVVVHRDIVAAGAHDVCSLYVETFWTPIVGPAAMLAARSLARRLDAQPEFVIEVREFGLGLGLQPKHHTGEPLSVKNALYRLSRFGCARLDGAHLTLPMQWPTLSAEQVRWLPERLRLVARPPERTAAR